MNKKLTTHLPRLAIVIPCYNEADSISETASRLEKKIGALVARRAITDTSAVVFVDDGSKDNTWSKISQLAKDNLLFHGIKLSRNRGHQNALLAGLTEASKEYDIIISMDADLQDDINAIDKFIEKFNQGYEVVYGVRKHRPTDTIFKRVTALGFYNLMKTLGAESIYNHADYRLMSRRAARELANFREVNLFLRGIIPLIGYSSTTVEYDRGKRFAGESKYPVRKMLSFALEGITSFSIKPLRVVTILGLLISAISLIIMFYSLLAKITGHAVEGWTFTIISVWFIGGVQMLSIGVVGEYIGKIYSEVKQRPRFIIEDEI